MLTCMSFGHAWAPSSFDPRACTHAHTRTHAHAHAQTEQHAVLLEHSCLWVSLG